MSKALPCLFSVVSLLAFGAAAHAAETSLDSTTIVRFEQHDNGSQKESIVPATEFLGLDADKLADGNLSLHFYGWGRADLADKSYNIQNADGRLSYGYLQYRFKQANADLRAGRVFVHEGITNEQIDGISARSELPLGFGISAFGGATVHTAHLFGETSDGKGDSVFGGRANYRYRGMLELGISGVYESKAPTLIQPGHANGDHRLVGGDLWLSPYRQVEIIGHSSFNTETSRFAEHSYLVNVKPAGRLVLSAEFNQQNDRSYQYAWSMFPGSALNPSDQSRSLGGSASYQIAKPLELAADYKHYHRELGDADRYGVNAKFSFLDNMARAGLGYHYLQAGSGFAIAPNTTGSYQELRGYAMHDTKGYFAALDLLDDIFKDKVFNEKSAWEVIGSLGYHLTPVLALSGDVSYGRNPEFIRETKGLVRLTYNMTLPGAGGKQ